MLHQRDTNLCLGVLDGESSVVDLRFPGVEECHWLNLK